MLYTVHLSGLYKNVIWLWVFFFSVLLCLIVLVLYPVHLTGLCKPSLSPLLCQYHVQIIRGRCQRCHPLPLYWGGAGLPYHCICCLQSSRLGGQETRLGALGEAWLWGEVGGACTRGLMRIPLWRCSSPFAELCRDNDTALPTGRSGAAAQFPRFPARILQAHCPALLHSAAALILQSMNRTICLFSL